MSEPSLILRLNEAYQDAILASLATGQPLKRSVVVAEVTGGDPKALVALHSELLQQEFDRGRMMIQYPAYLKAQRQLLDDVHRWLNGVEMTVDSIFEIAQMIEGQAFDVETSSLGEAWSRITDGGTR